MMNAVLEEIGLREAALGAGALALVVILGALAFQHIGGYEPCALCLRQRWAYYAGIPLALLAGVLAGSRPALAAALLAAVAVGFLINAGLGVHHAGVEWGWWAGPAGCVGGGAELTTDASNMLEALRNTRVVPCDEPEFRFLGLSFAGFNALISGGLALLAGWGVRAYSSRRVIAV